MSDDILKTEKESTDSSKCTKICPYCAEEIKFNAIKCRFCQSDLTGNSEVRQVQSEIKVKKNQFGCGSAILAILIPIIGIIVGIVWLTSEEDKERAWPMIGVSLLGILLWILIF